MQILAHKRPRLGDHASTIMPFGVYAAMLPD